MFLLLVGVLWCYFWPFNGETCIFFSPPPRGGQSTRSATEQHPCSWQEFNALLMDMCHLGHVLDGMIGLSIKQGNVSVGFMWKTKLNVLSECLLEWISEGWMMYLLKYSLTATGVACLSKNMKSLGTYPQTEKTQADASLFGKQSLSQCKLRVGTFLPRSPYGSLNTCGVSLSMGPDRKQSICPSS